MSYVISKIGSRNCSLPSPGCGYNPRNSQEYYKLRSFSIKKGRVIKLGDSMESRKSRSASYNASAGTSGCASPRSPMNCDSFNSPSISPLPPEHEEDGRQKVG